MAIIRMAMIRMCWKLVLVLQWSKKVSQRFTTKNRLLKAKGVFGSISCSNLRYDQYSTWATLLVDLFKRQGSYHPRALFSQQLFQGFLEFVSRAHLRPSTL